MMRRTRTMVMVGAIVMGAAGTTRAQLRLYGVNAPGTAGPVVGLGAAPVGFGVMGYGVGGAFGYGGLGVGYGPYGLGYYGPAAGPVGVAYPGAGYGALLATGDSGIGVSRLGPMPTYGMGFSRGYVVGPGGPGMPAVGGAGLGPPPLMLYGVFPGPPN